MTSSPHDRALASAQWRSRSHIRRIARGAFACVIAALACCGSLAHAQTSASWLPTAAGTYTWGTGTNWSGGVAASGTGSVASFVVDAAASTFPAAAQTINLDGTVTTGTIRWEDTSGGTVVPYNIAPGTSGTLNLATVAGSTPTISFVGSSGNQNLVISAPISGTQGLQVGGLGTNTAQVWLTGVNTFTGNLTVDARPALFFNLEGNGRLGSGDFAGNVSLGTGATARMNMAGLQILSGSLSGAGTVEMWGAPTFSPTTTGTLALNAANTGFTGTVNLNRNPGTASQGRVLQLGNANALRNATLRTSTSALANAGTRTVQFASGIGTFNLGGLNAGDNGTGNIVLTDTSNNAITLAVGWNNAASAFSGTFSGAGGLTKVGSGTLTLSAANTYTGTTTISAGQLSLSGGNNRLATNAPITITGGVLDLGSASQTTSGAISFQGGTVQSGTLNNTGGAFDGQAGTVSAVLAGSVGLTKTGAGQLTLTGANTYSGTTTISAGVLSISSTAALPGWNVGGRWSAASGAALVAGDSVTDSDFASLLSSGNYAAGAATGFDTTANRTYGSAIADTGAGALGLRKLGSGTLTLSGTNTFTGGSTISAGRLVVGNSAALGASTGPLAVNAGTLDLGGFSVNVGALSGSAGAVITTNAAAGTATLTTNAASNSTFAGTIQNNGSGVLALTKTGAGQLTLTAANTYTGTTTVDNGTLFFGDTGASIRGPLTINAGGTASVGQWSLGFVGSNPVTSIAINGGVLDVRNVGGFVTLGAPNTVTMAGGTISGPAPAMLYASGGAYNPVFTIVASPTTATISSGLELRMNSNANIVTFNVGAGTTPSGVDLLVSGPIISSTLTLTGGGLTKSGAGLMRLTAANTYTGATTVNAGILEIGGGSTTGSLSGSTAITGSAGGTLAFNRSDNYGGAFGNTIGGGVGVLLSGGTLTLSGTNTFTGGSTISAGRLVVSNSAALGASTSAVAVNAGTLDLGGFSVNVGAVSGSAGAVITTSAAAGTATLTTSAASNSTFAGTIQDNGSGRVALTKLGSGTLTLTAANTYTGTTTISAGRLALSGGNNRLAAAAPLTITGGVLDLGSAGQTTSGAISFQGGTVQSGTLTSTGGAFDGQAGVVSAVLAGSVGLTKTGTGLFALTGANTYSGTTTVNNGTLYFGDIVSTTPIIRGPLTINAGGTASLGTWSLGYVGATNRVTTIAINGGVLDMRSFLDVSGTLALLGSPNTVTMTGGTISGPAPGQLWASSGAYNPVFTIVASPTTATISSGLDLRMNSDANIVTFNVGAGTTPSGVDLLVSGPIIRSALAQAGGGLTKSGAGLMRLTAANTYTGATTVNAGILEIGGGSTTGSLSGSTAITGSAGGTLAFNRSDNYGGAFGNAISGGLGVVVRTGTLTLSNVANSYTGPTSVQNGGTLLVNGGLTGAGAVTVDSGATLGGSGSIAGAVTVNGLFSPGTSPGVLSVASLVLGGSSTSVFEIDGLTRATQYDGTDVTGALAYGGSLVIDFGSGITAALPDDTIFNLFDFGSYTGAFTSITTANDGSFYAGLTFTGSGDTWTATKDSQTLEFTHSTGNLVIVPEPGAIALAAIGIAAAAWARRRSYGKPGAEATG